MIGRTRLCFSLFACSLVLGCSGSSGGSSAPPPVAPAATPAPSQPATNPPPSPPSNPPASAQGTQGSGGQIGLQTRTVTVNGQSRDYWIYAPIGYDSAQAWPIVWVFHGQGGQASNTLNLWLGVADTEGFLVGALQSSGSTGGWVFGSDTQVFSKALQDARGAFNLDQKRFYLWGFSAGGHFVHSLGLSNSQYFAAYAVSAGVVTQAVQAQRAIPVSIHIGLQDPLLPYAQNDHQQLLNRGHPVDYHEFSGGHTYTPSHIQQIWDDLKDHQAP